MPRVGSIRSRTLKWVVNHRPTATFCWFPPLSLRTDSLREGAFTPIFWTIVLTTARTREREMTPMRVQSLNEQAIIFSSTVLSMKSPSDLRSSGTSAMPARRASGAFRREILFPSISTEPRVIVFSPKRLSMSSACPCPCSPPSPTISPDRS